MNEINILIPKKSDKDWSFEKCKKSETNYLTHGYHPYPAKFIPQIASKLIKENSKKGDMVVDPFGGCGTTMLEAKMLDRAFVGVDINPVAVLISKAKSNAINPNKLEKSLNEIITKIDKFNSKSRVKKIKNERISYWFREGEKRKLAFLLERINKISDSKSRLFFKCVFSSILKNCSIWLQKSNKPTVDKDKKIEDPFILFIRKSRRMIKNNNEFFNELKNVKSNNLKQKVYKSDARNIPIEDGAVDLVVTSPPYVTSYEYADLHQLTALWFDFIVELKDFRNKFIGTRYKDGSRKIIQDTPVQSKLIKKLYTKDRSLAKKVNLYYGDMYEAFIEMHRILKKKGKACVVIGDTKLRDVDICNSKVFISQLNQIGFKIERVIKRKISSKNITSTRDRDTGKFTNVGNKNKMNIYKYEYIIIFQKM